MTIRPKLWVTLILKFIIKSYPYISYTIFMEVLLLYFVRYNIFNDLLQNR